MPAPRNAYTSEPVTSRVASDGRIVLSLSPQCAATIYSLVGATSLGTLHSLKMPGALAPNENGTYSHIPTADLINNPVWTTVDHMWSALRAHDVYNTLKDKVCQEYLNGQLVLVDGATSARIKALKDEVAAQQRFTDTLAATNRELRAENQKLVRALGNITASAQTLMLDIEDATK